MDVSFKNMRDLHIICLGYFYISIHISFRIDNRGYSSLLTTDKIACLGKALIIDTFKIHNDLF